MAPSLATTLSDPRLPGGGGETTVRVRIEPEQAHGKRELVVRQVVLCLDVSRSMAEDGKLDSAKAGARRVLEELDDRDSVGVVAFDQSVETPVGLTRRSDLDLADATERIDDLTASHGTNVFAGLRQAQRMLAGLERGPHVAREIVLLSDGHGIQDPPTFASLGEELREEGISVMAGGIGDYDDDAMVAVADGSDGLSTHLAAAEDIEAFLHGAVEAAGDLVAANPALRVRVGDAFKLGAAYLLEPEVKAREPVAEGDEQVLRLPDLLAGQPQTVLLHFFGQPRTPGSAVTLADLRLAAESTLAESSVEVEYVEQPMDGDGSVAAGGESLAAGDGSVAADESGATGDESVAADFTYARLAARLKAVSSAAELREVREEIEAIDHEDVRADLQHLLERGKTEI